MREPDPHYLALLQGTNLPSSYMPPTMSGERKPWIRIGALVLIACFLGATISGVCLTYGHAF